MTCEIGKPPVLWNETEWCSLPGILKAAASRRSPNRVEDRQPLTCEIGKPPVLWNETEWCSLPGILKAAASRRTPNRIEDRQPLTCEIGKPPVLWNDGIALARPANTARRTEGGAFAAFANRVLRLLPNAPEKLFTPTANRT